MHPYLIDMLECPACHGKLDWNIIERDESRIVVAEAACQTCAALYPVRDGIGLFLTPERSRGDLWEQVDSGLMQYLHERSDLEQRLLETPLNSLAPADQFYRALALEARGNYSEARAAEEAARTGLYTPEYLNCWNSQVEYVVEWLSTRAGPIVDLASGRGYLAEQLVRRLKRPGVVTDFSPSVLRRDRRWLERAGVYEQISLLAFDARHTPFKDGAVATLTTNLGLPNIAEPGSLLKELRRISAGVFLAISHFYPEDDAANAKAIQAAGLNTLLYRQSTLQQYVEAGWAVEVKNACIGKARPTPPAMILEGATVDGLPVVETVLEWCVLLGTSQVSNSPDCVLCRGVAGDVELHRIQVWEDSLWRLTLSLEAEVLGFSYLEPKRHIPHITDLAGEEARTFGEVLARVSQVLRDETGAELVYVYIFGGGVPHLHVHLAPHRPDDALNTQMIRGDLVEEKLPSGAGRFISKEFPPLPEEEQRAVARHVQQRLMAAG